MICTCPSHTLRLALVILLGLACGQQRSHHHHQQKEVHAFLYLWYGTPSHDSAYKHWNHEVLPHWTQHVSRQFPQIGTLFSPPNELHSRFYPSYGVYSSRNPGVISRQIDDMVRAGVDVAVMSWWGQETKAESTDTQGASTDATLAEVLPLFCSDGRVRVAFHLEPYPGRSISSVKEDIVYLVQKYGHHSCIDKRGGRPVIYIYDSYHIKSHEWLQLLDKDGDLSIRGTAHDAFVFGLWLEHHHGSDLAQSRFDGAYSYFASDGFSYGSTSANWRSMCTYLRKRAMACNLSVGPGYDDTLIRPWNAHNAKSRAGGAYFDSMFEAAIKSDPDVISITSWNEWGEGTQIEPAVPYTAYTATYDTHSAEGLQGQGQRVYEGYGTASSSGEEDGGDLYILKTRAWKDTWLAGQGQKKAPAGGRGREL